MDIPKIKFKTISKDKICDNILKAPFITLYHNYLYLPKPVALLIKGKYYFASLSTANNILAIDFSRTEKKNAFEVIVNSNEKLGTVWGKIGATSLAQRIANELGLVINKNRYYKSIDYEIKGNVMYFKFDKGTVKYSKRSK